MSTTERLIVNTSEDANDHSFRSMPSPEYVHNKPKPIHVNTNIQSAQNSISYGPSSPFFAPPKLQRSSSRMLEFVSSKMTAGSVKGSIFTMCISIVGAGALALPYAMRGVGLIFGIFLIFFGALLAYFTLDLLLISAEYLPEHLRGPKPLRNISYQALAKYSYGPRFSKALQVLMSIQYFGSMVAYIVAFSGFIDLVYSIYPHPDGWPDTIYTICCVGISYGVILPLSLLRDMNSLRFTSLLGFSMAIYLVIVVTIEYFILCIDTDGITDQHYDTTCIWNDRYHLSSDILWPMNTFKHFYEGFFTSVPLVIFAYTGHMYLLPLYVELARPSIRRMRKVFRSGIIIINVLYAFISIFGFLLFLDQVCSNLLLNNFRKHFDVVIASLGISISCILTEPIFAYNFRRMIGLLVWDKTTKEISTTWHIVITVVFVTMNVALGIAVKSIAVVFGFLGCTTYPLFGYIFPTMFFCKLTPEGKYKIRKIVAVTQAVIVGIISLCSLVYKIYSPGDLSCSNAQTIG